MTDPENSGGPGKSLNADPDEDDRKGYRGARIARQSYREPQEAEMGRRIAGSALSFLILAAAWAVPARGEAQNWAEKMFRELGHDFGPVPRGAVVRHNFVMTNRYNDALTILDVRASCGCTSGRASATTVADGQVANIEAAMDTRNFVGRKATKLTVSFLTSSGKTAEVQIAVVSNILPDIVLNPGTVDFGSLAKGQTATVVMTIEPHERPPAGSSSG